jgi:hypothetical protein
MEMEFNYYENEEFCCTCNGYEDGCECDCHGEELELEFEENFLDNQAGYQSHAEVAFYKLKEIESLMEESRHYQNACFDEKDWQGFWCIQALRDKLFYAHKEISFLAYNED